MNQALQNGPYYFLDNFPQLMLLSYGFGLNSGVSVFPPQPAAGSFNYSKRGSTIS